LKFGVGKRSLPVWKDKDILSSWSGGISGEAAVRQTACMQHSHSENCTWMAGKASLRQDTPCCVTSAEIWPRCHSPQVRFYLL